MPRLEGTIDESAPVENVFGFLSNPNNLTRYWPSLEAVRDIRRLPNGGLFYRWPYTRDGIAYEGTSEDITFEPCERIVTRARGGLDSTISWTFDAWGDGTLLTVELEYELAVPEANSLVETIIHQQTEREFNTLLDNVVACAPDMACEQPWPALGGALRD